MINQLRDRVTTYTWLVRTLIRSGFLGSLRLDRYIRMGLNLWRHGGASPVSGIGLAAARAPKGLALVDEAGELTWGELDARCDALAVGLRELPG
ncbi:acyl-CoA synthetase, partial [Gordonia alkanivorans]|nr:acyl-CoA synthetase [Gordonia alkanivorans]